MELVFATHNLHKLEEVKTLLHSTITLLSLDDINYKDEIEESETTLEGNALIKARTIFNSMQGNCFADDSGLLVEALNGEPGVYSARYAGNQKNGDDNMNKLLTQLKGVHNRKAHFKTVLALILDEKEYLFEGVISGVIGYEKKGTQGFGYDPIFIPDGYSKTFAELTSSEKSTISHRSIALKKLITFLQHK
jgi:XTP/dITP diphosphohydrolase